MSLTEIILYITKLFYPTGRVFKIPIDSVIEKVHKALNVSEQEAYEAATDGVLDTILADNDNFTEEDASDWERRLAIISAEGTSLEDRKDAINRKYSAPGDIPARQHYLYLQRELQAASFDVYVHENIPAQNPGDFPFYSGGTPMQLGQKQLGQGFLGSITIDKVANRINPVGDESFSIGSDTRAIFYIGGAVLGDPADVEEIRREEFRQVILQVKPAQTVAVLFINYT